METILDNHLHLSPKGDPEAAIREFAEEGGTHVVSPNLLPSTYGIEILDGEDYEELFERHVQLIDTIDTDVEIYPLVGVHPAEITRLQGNMGLDGAVEAAKTGLDIAAQYVKDGLAVGLGEIGRPHYDVPQDVVEAANDALRHGFRLASKLDCAVQLHTERLDGDGIRDMANMARSEGLDPGRVMHHFSPPLIEECREAGTVPSVLARKEFAREAAEKGGRFLMETDYLDDPRRPGAVLGPATVPRRTRRLLDEGVLTPDAARQVHRDLPSAVYGIDI